MAIFYNGQSSDDFRLIVEEYPVRTIPRKRYEEVSVPGRSGTVIFDEECYENVLRRYKCFISCETTKLYSALLRITEWLHGAGGKYATLQDDYDDGVFMKAYYAGGTEVESVMDRHGRLELEFNCKPFKYTIEGQSQVTVTNGGKLTNPTMNDSFPLIYVKMTTTGTAQLNIGDYHATIISPTPVELIIDSETQNCYSPDLATNYNMLLTLSDGFPKLKPGDNTVTWTGTISEVKVTPNYYYL